MRKHLYILLTIIVIGALIMGITVVTMDNRLLVNQISDELFYNSLLPLHDIGPVLAKRCVDYREQNGQIHIDEIINVNGIGEKRLKEIKKRFKDGD